MTQLSSDEIDLLWRLLSDTQVAQQRGFSRVLQGSIRFSRVLQGSLYPLYVEQVKVPFLKLASRQPLVCSESFFVVKNLPDLLDLLDLHLHLLS